MREEAASWRGKRKSLTFGFSAAEIESALAELEEIQQELLYEEEGANTVREEEVSHLLQDSICPVCQRGRVTETGEASLSLLLIT